MSARRALRLSALLLAAGGLATSPLWAPPALRRMAWFGADRIEVTGTRLLAPHEVVAASGIRIGDNVWTDPAAWERALRRLPVVASAEVERRLPNTLRIRIVEKQAAALVAGSTLRPATAHGEILPVDPSRVPVDLPLAGSAPDTARRVRGAATLALLAQAGRLAELDPALLGRVSELRAERGGATRLLLSSPRAEVLLPAHPTAPRLLQLRAALDDVERRIHPNAAGRALLDARFADQIVVRLPAAPLPTPPET
ncbi:MAG TPA: FtsQ-type POTRA domain-containing protein [Longimicrobium sp.]|nr:FtsQ-type POTRA domain-containing protein [Longimicrobium sp.]